MSRQSTQPLLPLRPPQVQDHRYGLYPASPLPPGSLQSGYDALARVLAAQRSATLDGFPGVDWNEARQELGRALESLGIQVRWTDVRQALKPQAGRERLAAPFLGGNDPLFGHLSDLELEDFFDAAELKTISETESDGLHLVYGEGAELAGLPGPLLYLDLPKNEQQYRARAGEATNLGVPVPLPAREAYKRSFFLDWPVLGRHRAAVLPRVDWFVDTQRPGVPVFVPGDFLRAGLDTLAQTSFRVRPWFEPGVWGGQWILEHLPELPRDVPNYAWSFELITPENGLLFAADDLLLEVGFDWLLFQAGHSVLGEAYDRFGPNFPVRFDWLDTVGGGNLSLQVHPRPAYIRHEFGEAFTQDETYYILAAEEGAQVYLGLQEGADPLAFRQAAEESARSGAVLDVGRYVQSHAARPHGLFLIPSGTVHGAGAGTLVLEISATPYIYTFKLYDWQRLDLTGQPRPLNLERGFANLDVSRAGASVQALLPSPVLAETRQHGSSFTLPTDAEQFFAIERLEFEGTWSLETLDRCLVLAVVEGEGVSVTTPDGTTRRYAYAETFVLPAGAGQAVLESSGPIKVIVAFVKPGRGP